MPDIGPTVKAAALSQMEAAMDALSRELVKLRTGRASAGEAIFHFNTLCLVCIRCFEKLKLLEEDFLLCY